MPAEQQRQRKPSYYSAPTIRAAPVPAAPATDASSNGAAAAAAAPVAQTQHSVPVEEAPRKELPPLLRARLAKRGILPQARSQVAILAKLCSAAYM